MENQISFIQIEKDNAAHYEAAQKLWVPFIREINLHEGTHQTDEQIIDGFRKRIAVQGCRKNMHFELALMDGVSFGIAMFAIDLGTVYGLLEKGCGTIMGFYIHPDYRRKGLGTIFSKHIETVLCNAGATKMYICPDAVTGEPFWKANGYEDSGKIDPDEQKPIYIKQVQPDFANGCLIPLVSDIANEIAQWEYEAPYEAYSFKGCPNEYLLDESTWGVEQFCMVDNGVLLGQVACQYEGDTLWIGWSMAPLLCGKGNGAAFVDRCVKELRRVKLHTGRMLLRVSARNRRAIKAYQKAGFQYVETIRDEIAYSDHIEDFWVMAL